MALASPAVAKAQTTTTYSYDPQGQVRTVTRPGQTVAYDYDAAANRTQVTATNTAARQAAGAATTAGKAASPPLPPFAVTVGAPPPVPAPPPFPPPPSPPRSPF